jgi:hypothetical protein
MFTALGFQKIRSDALVVFSGNGATDGDSQNGDGDDGNQHQLVLAKKEDSSLSSSRKLWETAILTAAALCVYQQQQQQQQQEKEQAIPHETPQEDERNHGYDLGSIHGKGNNREKRFRSPRFLRTRESTASSNHGYKNENERMHKSPTSGKEHDYIDNFEDHRQLHQQQQNRQQQQLRSKCVEKLVVLGSYHRRSEDCVGRNEKKQPPSPSQLEEDGFVPPTSKRPRDEERLNNKLVEDGFEMSHDNDALRNTLRDPSSSKQKQPSNQNPKEQKLEKSKRKELMLFQRFGLLSSRKNRKDSEISVTTSTKSHCMYDNDDSTTQVYKDIPAVGTPSVFQDTQSEESEDGDDRGGKSNGDSNECLAEKTDSEEHVPVNIVDYSSPIEFPVCLDYYEEEEEQKEDVDGNSCTPFEKYVQSPDYTSMNTAYPASHSSEQRKIQRKRKRRRTSEERKFRMKDKRRKIERKNKRDKHRSRWEPDGCVCDGGDEKGERDRLETPKKLDFKDFGACGGSSEKEDVDKLETPRKLDFKEFCSDGGDGNEEGDKLETPKKLDFKEFCAGGDNDNEQGDTLETPRKLDFKKLYAGGSDENEERDKLETPKKLDFREFSPVEALGNQRDSDGFIRASDQNENIFHSSNIVIRMSAKNCDKNDELLESTLFEANGSYHRLEDGIAPNDPFSVPSEDILQVTTTCPDAAAHGQQQAPMIHLFCSEIFLENFGEVIAEVVRSDVSLVGMPIRFTDTDLVDVCGVDIETPSRGAMVVSKLSQIQHSSGGLMGAFLPRIVELAATNRYGNLFVFLCVDIELDSEVARDLVRLQTAFLFGERGMSMTRTSFQWSSKRSLGACIAQTIELSAKSGGDFPFSAPPNIDHWLSDLRTCQRLKFLLFIIPTLSLTGALHWLELSIGGPVSYRSPSRLPTQHSPLEEEDKSSEWFQRCFKNVDEESDRLESCMLRSNPNNSDSSNPGLWNSMNTSVPKQLVRVVGARLNEI